MQSPPNMTPPKTMQLLKCFVPAGILFLAFPVAGRCQSNNNQEDSQPVNINGQVVVNRAGGHPTIQEAIDLAWSRGGGDVLVPSGRYVLRQIVLRHLVNLKGFGPHAAGTTLEQAPGVNADFIVSDTKLSATDTQHWSTISNLRI